HAPWRPGTSSPGNPAPTRYSPPPICAGQFGISSAPPSKNYMLSLFSLPRPRFAPRCREAAQAGSGLFAVEPRRGHVEHERLPGFAIRRRLDAVQPQEDDRGSHRSALVAVVESMIPAQVEQIGGGDLHDIRVRRLAAEAGLRSAYRRREQSLVAHASQAAKFIDHRLVDSPDDVHRKVD